MIARVRSVGRDGIILVMRVKLAMAAVVVLGAIILVMRAVLAMV